MGGLIDVIGHDVLPLAKIVGASAPVLGSILGSPLAGIAISLLAGAFGVDSKNVSGLLSAISSDPESSSKLRALEMQHCEALKDIERQNFATEVEDRINARQSSVNYKDFLKHMSYMVTIGFFLALFLLFVPITVSNEEKNLLSMLVGMLASKWQTIIDFWYGSSRPQPNQGGFKNG